MLLKEGEWLSFERQGCWWVGHASVDGHTSMHKWTALIELRKLLITILKERTLTWVGDRMDGTSWAGER